MTPTDVKRDIFHTLKDSQKSSCAADSHEPARGGAWFAEAAWSALGLPAPVRKLLESGG